MPEEYVPKRNRSIEEICAALDAVEAYRQTPEGREKFSEGVKENRREQIRKYNNRRQRIYL